jgi:ATP-dependent helicase YprA (DUF1998 family)
MSIRDAPSTTVTQHLQFCGSEMGKLLALRNDIAAGKLPAPVLIFVQSIERANELYQELVMDGMRVGAVHGEKSKAEREKTVREFREGKLWMLVVTELMARGLDFKGIEVVVNYGEYKSVMRSRWRCVRVEIELKRRMRPGNRFPSDCRVVRTPNRSSGSGGQNRICYHLFHPGRRAVPEDVRRRIVIEQPRLFLHDTQAD